AAGGGPGAGIRARAGGFRAWSEVGVPDGARLHRAAKQSERVAVYTWKPSGNALRQLAGETIHRAAEIPIYTVEPALIAALAAALDRRLRLTLSVSGRHLYLTVAGRSLAGAVVETRLG